VFSAMAGIGMLLFFSEARDLGGTAEIYRLIASPTLPAIPLLTACGYLLAESGAAQRLVRFFRALFGWLARRHRGAGAGSAPSSPLSPAAPASPSSRSAAWSTRSCARRLLGALLARW